ncbi:acid phosphatase [Xanthomonas phaseoli pv. syngonii LMG 9055]|uniref:Acid phosphatase n=1 Tax=Xanthomonas phaseoli pv. syngonii LMG 9055 TaxID=1437878 RepID=A0A1V9GSQ5_9XANT|nr:acid phosphatase [Xanthomonas phaseoli pv. syngonii LMG 9055]
MSAQGYADPVPAFFRCDAMQGGRRHRRCGADQPRAPASGLGIQERARAQMRHRVENTDAATPSDDRHCGDRHQCASVIPMALPSAGTSDTARTG